MRPELAFTYDADMRPVAAKCTACREQMPPPPPELKDNADLIMWFSRHFFEHRAITHPTPPHDEADNPDTDNR